VVVEWKKKGKGRVVGKGDWDLRKEMERGRGEKGSQEIP